MHPCRDRSRHPPTATSSRFRTSAVSTIATNDEPRNTRGAILPKISAQSNSDGACRQVSDRARRTVQRASRADLTSKAGTFSGLREMATERACDRVFSRDSNVRRSSRRLDAESELLSRSTNTIVQAEEFHAGNAGSSRQC